MTARTGINISHSALLTEEGCPLRGYLTVRRGIGEVEEDTKSRRGSIGHALLAARMVGEVSDDDLEAAARGTFHAVAHLIDREHEKRGWPDILATYEDARHAAHGALALARWADAEGMRPFSDDVVTLGEDMVEAAVTAPIDHAIDLLADAGMPLDDGDADALRQYCATVKAKIDMVTADREVVDWKFARSLPSPDDFDAESVPDPQHSWYAFVLACTGFEVTRGHRVTVHAEVPAPLATATDLPRRKDGLPMLVHPPTTAASFLEALATSLYTTGTGKNARTVDLAAYRATIEDIAFAIASCGGGEKARAAALEMRLHHADLLAADAARTTGPAIAARSHDLWPHHYLRLAHERLTMFAQRLRSSLASRNLRVYPGSPCVRSNRGGVLCPVQRICRATLDGQDMDEAIDDAVREESHRRGRGKEP